MIIKKLNNKTFIFKEYKEPNYKEIVYDGKIYKYEQIEDGYGYKTIFYYGTEYNSHLKYLLFGPVIIKTTPKIIFKIIGHIESETGSKNSVIMAIKEKVDLINRREEIKRGEII